MWRRLRFSLSRRRLLDEASDELRWHHEMLTQRYIKAGMSPEEATLAASRQLGNITRVREDIYQMNTIRWLDAFAQDVRYALRGFARNRVFAAVVVITLALGIGANSAILSIAYSVLVKPLPYERPDEIYSVEVIVPERRAQMPSLPPTLQTYVTWRNAKTVFADLTTLTPWEASVTGDGEPERIGGARVGANFFAMLGVPIALGRTFRADEEQPGRERVVVISDGLWRRRFAADPFVIGRALLINGEPHEVVGIAAPSLLVPTGLELHPVLLFARSVDIWKPIAPRPTTINNESWDHGVLVRLPAGENLETGRQQLLAILTERARREMPRVKTEPLIDLVPVREIYAGKVRLRLLLVVAASALLLLAACASIANMFFARAARRSREFATRIALGAGRGRIVSQTLTETILLAAAGGAIGLVLAKYGSRMLASYGPEDVQRLTDASLNWPLFMFAMIVSLVAGIACGVVPALQAYGRGPRPARSRLALIGIEMALATVLLASAGLLLHSFSKVMSTDRGYEVERVVAVDLSLFGQRYATGASRIAFYNELVTTVRALPGVTAAGAINNLPAVSASDGASRTIFYAADADFQRLVLARPLAMIRSVTSGYLVASGAALRAGRFLADEEPAMAAVISESLAHSLWPGEPLASVVGRQFRQGDITTPLISIVGVIADARPGALDREPTPAVYRPYAQWASGPMTLLVKTAQDPASVAQAVRAVIRNQDANLPIAAMRTMREIVSATVAHRRFQMTLTTLFALVALLLGAVGVYGVVSHAVASRTREIGLRVALGAARADVMRSVFAFGMRPVLAGLAVGLTGAIALATVLRSVLYGITPTDPLSLGVVVLVLLSTAAVACYVPARRAAALNPTIALRHD